MRLDHAIPIAAPREVVWATTVDIDRWSRWTPTVTRAKRLDDGDFRLGSEASLEQPGLGTNVWRVVEIEPGKRFAWRAVVRGMPMWAKHEIIDAPNGCENRLSLEISGWLAWLLWPLLASGARRALAQENQGLKAFCERSAEASRG